MAGAVARPRGLPTWAAPVAAAVVAVVLGVAHRPGHLVRPLAAPIAFLLLAVPLAALLDEVGFFTACAEHAQHSRHLVLVLWVFAAAVTTVLNLDAAVVLLTPLYVRIARRSGLDPVALGFQPVLLSCLASSALPVSNLTNLIAASSRHLGTAAFLVHLGPPSLVATTVGWFAYRRVLDPGTPSPAPAASPDRRALRIGAGAVAYLVIGFTVGRSLGVPEWVVVLLADLVLMGLTRRAPIDAVPWGAAAVAGSLGVLAGAAASHLPLDRLLSGSGPADLLRIGVAAAAGANLLNNLPALLVALPHTGDGVWALLLGVNIGPLVLLTGSLAALLWHASLTRLDVHVSARQFARVGATVLVPSLAAALAVLLLSSRALGT